MIIAEVLLQWNPDRTPKVTLSHGDSIMDVTGQLVENIPPQKKLVTWELWTDDITPYEADPEIYVISWHEVIEDEAP